MVLKALRCNPMPRIAFNCKSLRIIAMRRRRDYLRPLTRRYADPEWGASTKEQLRRTVCVLFHSRSLWQACPLNFAQ